MTQEEMDVLIQQMIETIPKSHPFSLRVVVSIVFAVAIFAFTVGTGWKVISNMPEITKADYKTIKEYVGGKYDRKEMYDKIIRDFQDEQKAIKKKQKQDDTWRKEFKKDIKNEFKELRKEFREELREIRKRLPA